MSDIKIFVCNTPGKHSKQIDDPLYFPMLGGAELNSDNPSLLPGDNTGDNISNKNSTYCELTVQYWAWKNADADYYGFCHYRRYFDFSQHRKEKDEYGNIIESYINPRTIQKFSLIGELPRHLIESSDIVVTDRVNVHKMPRHFIDIEDHFVNDSGFLHRHDLALLRQIIKELSPEYLNMYDRYFSGQSGYFCNMFIARKEIFYRYCEWLFPILEAFENRADMSHYSVQSMRVTGHLAERLLGIFIDYQKEQNPTLKITEVPCVFFQSPESVSPVAKPSVKNNVPIVFAANNAFVGPLGVALKSLIDHISERAFYDIVVLESDITASNKQRLRGMLTKPNLQLRFVNVLPLLDGYTLVAHVHISKETFFRFVIQEIMPDYEKTLYLDCDIVVESDVADLYDTDVTGYLLAAAHDIDFASQINGYNKKMSHYAKQILKMQDPYQYFQAGVLLFNLIEMRKEHSLDEWLTLASDDYKYSDQDVLNRYCQGRVKYFGQEWNFLFDNDFTRVNHVLCFAPKELMDEYKQVQCNPKIIHYAGFAKPWLYLPADRSDNFWSVARATPFYEELLFQMTVHKTRAMTQNCMNDHVYWHHAIFRGIRIRLKRKLTQIARNIADCTIPKGSLRREQVKRFACKLTGRTYVEPDYRVR